MELKLPSTAGARPPKKKMMFLPKVSSCLRLPLRKPSPTPTSNNSEPTPQAIPNMVRNERSLCAQSVRSVWLKVSNSMRMGAPHAAGDLSRQSRTDAGKRLDSQNAKGLSRFRKRNEHRRESAKA